ncbi:MAG: S8 family serine peptidase [Alphaproteobacteria bacterium]
MLYKPALGLGLAAVLGSWMVPALAQNAPVDVKPTPGLELAVRSSYIFRFSDDVPAAEVRARATAAVADVGGRLNFVYTTAIKGFAATMPDVAVNNLLARNPQIVSVEPDGIVTMDKPPPGKGPNKDKGNGGGGGGPAQVIDWGVWRSGGPAYGYATQPYAQTRTAWVIDTGIDKDHPDLNVVGGRNFVCLFRCRAKAWDDGNGHGTHVAGIMGALDNGTGTVGIAPGARLYAVRVLDNNGSGTYSGVIAGVDYVAANAGEYDVANMSLIGGPSQALDDAVRNAAALHIYFSLAGGNNGDDANKYSPARVNDPYVFTVSAIDSSDDFASFSNHGNPPVDFAAPGVGVFSTYKGGGYATLSGTSMAAPHVGGLLLVEQKPPSSCNTANNDPDGNPDPIAYYSGATCPPPVPSS